MLLVFLALQAASPFAATDLQDVERIGAVCRAANEASLTSGDAAEWLRVIDEAATRGNLSVADRIILFRHCGVYQQAMIDAATEQAADLRRQLDANRDQGLEALRRYQQRR